MKTNMDDRFEATPELKQIISERLKKLAVQSEANARKCLDLLAETPKVIFEENGTVAVEHALLLMLIAAVIAGSIAYLGGGVKTFFDTIANLVSLANQGF